MGGARPRSGPRPGPVPETTAVFEPVGPRDAKISNFVFLCLLWDTCDEIQIDVDAFVDLLCIS